MNIKSFVFNPFFENTYLLISNNGETIIVDPGCYEDHEKKTITEFIDSERLKPILIANTHCHIDHVLGNAFLKDLYNVPLWVPKLDEPQLRSVEAYAPNYGITNYHPSEPDKLITEMDLITFGDETLKILFAPGHAPGHLMFYHQMDKKLLAGDVIFRESIGRTDLPGGDFRTLEQSIRSQIFTLPDEVTIYPGHGPETTVKHEKSNNPFVKN